MRLPFEQELFSPKCQCLNFDFFFVGLHLVENETISNIGTISVQLSFKNDENTNPNLTEWNWIESNEMEWNDSVEIAAYAQRSIEIVGLIVSIAYWWLFFSANFSLINGSIFNLLKFNCSIDILEISLCSNKTFIFFSHSEKAYLLNARRMFRIFLIRIAIKKNSTKNSLFSSLVTQHRNVCRLVTKLMEWIAKQKKSKGNKGSKWMCQLGKLTNIIIRLSKRLFLNIDVFSS